MKKGTFKKFRKGFLEDAFTDEKPLSKKNSLLGMIVCCEVTGLIFTMTFWFCIILGMIVTSIVAVMTVFAVPGYSIEKDKEKNWKQYKKEESGY